MAIRDCLIAGLLALAPAAYAGDHGTAYVSDEERKEWSVDRKEFERNLKHELGRLRGRIDRIEESGESGSRDTARRLRERADRLEDRLAEVRESGGKRWDKTRARVRREYDELSSDVRSFLERRRDRR